MVLVGRLRDAIRRLNPHIPDDALDEAGRKVLRVGTPSLTQTNRAFHKMLRDGVAVEYPHPLRESACEDQVMVKRILNKYGYPPDLQDDAVKTVLAQAELLRAEWL